MVRGSSIIKVTSWRIGRDVAAVNVRIGCLGLNNQGQVEALPKADGIHAVLSPTEN